MYQKHILYVIGIIFFSGCSFFSEKRDDILIVGTSADCPPYEYLNDQGDVEGFDSELSKLIAQRLHKKLEIRNMSFDSLILALQQNKIDIIVSALSITARRKQEIVLVPYHESSMNYVPLLFWERIPEGVKTIEDLAKYHPTVVVQAGTFHEDVVSRYPFIAVKSLDTIPNIILDLQYKKSLAAIIDSGALATIQKTRPEIVSLMVPLEKNLDIGSLGIGIKKDNQKLINDIQEIITTLKAEGVLQRLEAQWLGEKNHD